MENKKEAEHEEAFPTYEVQRIPVRDENISCYAHESYAFKARLPVYMCGRTEVTEEAAEAGFIIAAAQMLMSRALFEFRGGRTVSWEAIRDLWSDVLCGVMYARCTSCECDVRIPEGYAQRALTDRIALRGTPWNEQSVLRHPTLGRVYQCIQRQMKVQGPWKTVLTSKEY